MVPGGRDRLDSVGAGFRLLRSLVFNFEEGNLEVGGKQKKLQTILSLGCDGSF